MQSHARDTRAFAAQPLITAAYPNKRRCKTHWNELSDALILQIKATNAAQESTFSKFPDEQAPSSVSSFSSSPDGKTTFNLQTSAKIDYTIQKTGLLQIPV